jgi:hypothetical protein
LSAGGNEDMKCPKCNCENPDEKKFCGDCGARLQTTGYLSDDELRATIRAAIREELADQKVVEVEITESVLERITGWAKTLGFFAGIPLAALLLVLGLLGLKKYSDLWELASAAEQRIGPVVKHAQDTAADVDATTHRLQKQSGEIEAEIANLKPRLEAISKDAEKFSELEKNFDSRFTGLQASLDKKINDVVGEVNEIKQAVRPGSERWPVKTGTDEDVSRVDATPVATTIEELVKLARPWAPTLDPPAMQSRRAAPAELTVYTVEGTLVSGYLEADGDFVLTIAGPTGTTMRVEAPNPSPLFVSPTSRWAREISVVRKQLDEKLKPTQRVTRISVRARITGVGFFDRAHGATGAAPNVIELHPVLRAEFLQ